MKKILALLTICLLALFALFVLAGCSTPYKLTSYDEKGNITAVAEGEKDVIDKITESTKDKLVLGWSTGWAGYIKAVITEAETGTVTPTGEIYAGKVAKGYLSIPKNFDAKNVNIPLIVSATHENVAVGLTGISSASDTASANTSQAGTSAGGGTTSAAATTTETTTK